MTFLEYVCEKLMGPAESGTCWRCPFCDSPRASFSVRPPKKGFRVRFRCFRCDTWGDEFDLAKKFFPEDDYSKRRVRVRRWRIEYESTVFPTGERGAEGVELLWELVKGKLVDHDDLLEVVAELNCRHTLRLDAAAIERTQRTTKKKRRARDA